MPTKAIVAILAGTTVVALAAGGYGWSRLPVAKQTFPGQNAGLIQAGFIRDGQICQIREPCCKRWTLTRSKCAKWSYCYRKCQKR